MRKFLIAGNWKMNTSFEEAVHIAQTLRILFKENEITNEVLICPPYIWLKSMREILNLSGVKVGAQNCHHEKSGAYTGEISIPMLEEARMNYTIIGHSERRQIFKENDEMINLKLKALLKSKIKPILCIGETLEERQNNLTFEIIESQIEKAFSGVSMELLEKVTIAYEPVWAIGTGISASSDQAQEVHSYIRNYLKEHYNEQVSQVKILYGGSLNEKNAMELLNMPDIDGGLIGGASLKVESFIKIIEIADSISLA